MRPGWFFFFFVAEWFYLQKMKQDQTDISDFICELCWVSTLRLLTEVI